MDPEFELLLDLVEEFDPQSPEDLVEIVGALAGMVGVPLAVGYAGKKLGQWKGKHDADRDLKQYLVQQQAERDKRLRELKARRQEIVSSETQLRKQQAASEEE